MRDNNYLQSRLDALWDRYFSDIEQKNDVVIKFGRKARTRLGSIRQVVGVKRKEKREKSFLINQLTNQPINPSIITINGLLKDETIPEFLVDSVIAHEMVHYAHGFASPHEKKYSTPHAGGIIKKEMAERGLEDLFILQKKWLKDNWKEYLNINFPRRPVTRKKKRSLISILGR